MYDSAEVTVSCRAYLSETIRSPDEELAKFEPKPDVDVVFDGALEQLHDLHLLVVGGRQTLLVVDPEEVEAFLPKQIFSLSPYSPNILSV